MARIKPIKIDRPTGRQPERLLNLGPKSSAWLAALGLRTRAQLRALGPIEVCRRLRAAGQPVSVLMAYALEGAITGTHWNELPPETKSWLRTEFAQMKRPARGKD
jgi:DNA transformation protein and related proteins